MRPCIFCPNPRTRHRGEHIWDNWLNKYHADVFKRGGTVGELGKDGVLIREYKVRRVDITKPVVCDMCNNGWMSDITGYAKDAIEGFILHRRDATLVELGIITVAAFAFMKAAVLDYASEETRPHPLISPATCHRFRMSLQRGPTVFLPNGLQIWMAHYRGERKMEYRFWLDSMALNVGPYRGYTVLLVTYVVGAFVFQLTLPKWNKRAVPTVFPVFTQNAIWDVASVPIWPDVYRATWPPPRYLNSAALQDFRTRLATVQFL